MSGFPSVALSVSDKNVAQASCHMERQQPAGTMAVDVTKKMKNAGKLPAILKSLGIAG